MASQLPPLGYLAVLPALLLAGMMLGGLGLLLSSMIKQLENFAGVMNFIIFPMFFTSSALYPLWKVEEASPILRDICGLNPFTYAVELIRFALYGRFEGVSALVVAGLRGRVRRRRDRRLRPVQGHHHPRARRRAGLRG